jgi:predicted ATPase
LITKLQIQNFKSWRDTGELSLGAISVVFGPNSSGKSSLIQFLLLLKQTVENTDRSVILRLGGGMRDFVDVGTFSDALFRHDESRKLKFSIAWSAQRRSIGDSKGFQFSSTIGTHQNKIRVEALEYSVASQRHFQWSLPTKRLRARGASEQQSTFEVPLDSPIGLFNIPSDRLIEQESELRTQHMRDLEPLLFDLESLIHRLSDRRNHYRLRESEMQRRLSELLEHRAKVTRDAAEIQQRIPLADFDAALEKKRLLLEIEIERVGEEIRILTARVADELAIHVREVQELISHMVSSRLSGRLVGSPTVGLVVKDLNEFLQKTQTISDSGAFDIDPSFEQLTKRIVKARDRIQAELHDLKSTDNKALEYLDSLLDLPAEFEKLFARMYYIGPLREHPQRLYTWSSQDILSVGSRGEAAVDALLASAGTAGGSDESPSPNSLLGKVNEWLRRLGMAVVIKLVPLASRGRYYELRLRTAGTDVDVLATDVGFGFSQILPLVVQSYLAPENSIIILEQPEIHLHPAVQADLADLLLEVAKERKIQFIVESHSEHFLRRLQQRIAEAEMTAQDVSIYFCEASPDGSRATRLLVDEYGQITNWPKDFFGAVEDDLMAMTMARIKRQKQKEQGDG